MKSGKDCNDMKTTTFFWKTAALLAATLLLLLALAVGLSSCERTFILCRTFSEKNLSAKVG
ncbi:MAG: hypothetical protein LBT94_08560 [Prevotellaceae bacterium]|nr:hypothetical protein [Prevotellaceae bacterium]